MAVGLSGVSGAIGVGVLALLLDGVAYGTDIASRF
jgi:hypothetical protein